MIEPLKEALGDLMGDRSFFVSLARPFPRCHHYTSGCTSADYAGAFIEVGAKGVCNIHEEQFDSSSNEHSPLSFRLG